MAQLQGAHTLAIILGASAWPSYPPLQASTAFRQSADAFRVYLQDPAMCAVPATNVLWLFDTQDTPASLDAQMRAFLDARVTLEDSPITDLVLYYTGYGRMAVPDHTLQILLRTTDADAVAVSAYTLEALAQSLRRAAPRLRKWLFLDCYASAATSADLHPPSAPDLTAIIRAEMERTLPRSETAVFCASSAAQVALRPHGGDAPRFSGALLAVLHAGSADREEPMTLRDIATRVEARLISPEVDTALWPDLSSPDPQPGALATEPFFPNPFGATRIIPAELRALSRITTDPQSAPSIRAGVVRILGAWLRHADARIVAASRAWLETLHMEETHGRVRDAIAAVLQGADRQRVVGTQDPRTSPPLGQRARGASPPGRRLPRAEWDAFEERQGDAARDAWLQSLLPALRQQAVDWQVVIATTAARAEEADALGAQIRVAWEHTTPLVRLVPMAQHIRAGITELIYGTMDAARLTRTDQQKLTEWHGAVLDVYRFVAHSILRAPPSAPPREPVPRLRKAPSGWLAIGECLIVLN